MAPRAGKRPGHQARGQSSTKMSKASTNVGTTKQGLTAAAPQVAATSSSVIEYSAELDKRFKFRYDQKIVSRKADRKQARLEKKQRRASQQPQRASALAGAPRDTPMKPALAMSSGKPRPAAISANAPNISSKKRLNSSNNDDRGHNAKRAKNDNATPSRGTEKAAASEVKPKPAASSRDVSRDEERKMERLAERNPAFARMVQGLTGGAAGSFEEDEEEAMYYAKKLGFKGKRLKKALESDGLADIFSEEKQESKETSRDERKNPDRSGKEGRWKHVGDNDEDDQTGDEAEESDGREQLDGEIDEDGDDGSLLGGLVGDSEDEELDIDLDHDPYEDVESVGENENADMEASSDEGSEVSEGEKSRGTKAAAESNNSSSKTVKVAAAQSQPVSTASKYVPPHLRGKPTTQSEQLLRLRRQMQGVLNRLSDANLESIVNSIEEGFRNNPRHDMTQVITEIITSFVSDHANLLESFVATHSALIACIFNTIGLDFGAHLVQHVVELFEKTASSFDNKDDEDESSSKRMLNLATFISSLYNIGVIGCPLMYDVIRMCLARMKEVDVEVLLRVLRVSGQKLRSDDPSSLKDVVQAVHDESVKGNPVFEKSRVKFLVETIMDLKNNKKKVPKRSSNPSTTSANGAATDLQADRLLKFVRNLVRRRGIAEREPLRMTLEDIRSVETKGRWWLVGAAWAGHDGAGGGVAAIAAANAAAKAREAAAKATGSTDLLQLARAQKMNTDVRRSVFVVLMSSEDCVDAHERLLRLGLKDKQEREIVRVLLHCVGAEEAYNPYYALVAARICEGSVGMKITFQYALWDTIKAMTEGGDGDGEEEEEAGVRKIRNVSKLYAHLLATEKLSLSILKSIDFIGLPPRPALFCQLLLTLLLVGSLPGAVVPDKSYDVTLARIFSKLASQHELEGLHQGMRFFLQEYVTPSVRDGRPKMGVSVDSAIAGMKQSRDELVALVRRRAKAAVRLLEEDATF
ncbi:hypothetical protein DFJ73DRAFT_853544 [Zopfochytrium polystomum]|nr:hypothetical protein DFJ73DRAFT_853544 [Zopfochytrium polystomum]